MAEIARPAADQRTVSGSDDLFWALQNRQKSDEMASYKKRSPVNAAPSHRETFRPHPMAEFKKRIF